jgi:hypothetical protein
MERAQRGAPDTQNKIKMIVICSILLTNILLPPIMRNILHCLWACAGRGWQRAPKQVSPKFIIKTLSKFEKFLSKFTTFFKNNKLLIPTYNYKWLCGLCKKKYGSNFNSQVVSTKPISKTV